MKNNGKKLKVFVGLSGGVDSAVSAAILQKEGYEVTGVFIKAWTPEGYPCSWKEDRRSAMRVCAILNIPFLTLDLEKEYKKEVVDYMISEYKIGRTPNPDVMCNKEIKFGHFLKFALDSGAYFVATGHYAQILPKKHFRKVSLKKSSGSLVHDNGLGQTFFDKFSEELLEGADKNKDQSYFLWTLNQNQLKHILFPIGNLQKPEVRKLAEKFNLPQAVRKDSQGLCFLGKVDMKEFLSRYIPQKRGDVLLVSQSFSQDIGETKKSDSTKEVREKVIGYHDGALFFTIGERHGFTITEKTEREEPLYVVSKDVEKNTITVARKTSPPNHTSIKSKVVETPLSLTRRGGQGGEVIDCEKTQTNKTTTQKEKYCYEVFLQDTNWTLGEMPSTNKKYLCRIRYRQKKIGCKIICQSNQENNVEKNEVKIIFDEPQMGVASGQSLVLYSSSNKINEICLGGGIIK